jgi:hypothetical protein
MMDSIPFKIHETCLDGDVADLARQCFYHSVDFVNQLTTFIHTFYLKMSNAAVFTTKEAWDLVTAVIVKVFAD